MSGDERHPHQETPYETCLQWQPGAVPTVLSFFVWIKDKTGKWQRCGEQRVYLDIWDSQVNKGDGGHIRNPLLKTLQWRWDEPEPRYN